MRTISIFDVIFVLLQLALFFAFIYDVNAWRIYFPEIAFWIAVVLLVLGAFITLTAVLQLNKNISPFPTPLAGSNLIQNGVYRYLRHPIYTGMTLGFLGFSIIADSGYKLLITILLFLLFYGKSIYEERRLTQVFHNYKAYKARTGRFFPKVKRST